MDYLPQIAQQGLLGVMLVLSLLVNYFLFRELKDSINKRFEELIQNRETLRVASEGIKQTVDLILALVQNERKRRS